MRLVGVITTTVLISSYSSELCATVMQGSPSTASQPARGSLHTQHLINGGESSQATLGLPAIFLPRSAARGTAGTAHNETALNYEALEIWGELQLF